VWGYCRPTTTKKNKKAVLSQGEPRDAAVNFDTYRILQRHHAVSVTQHGFLVDLWLQSADNVGLLSKVSKEVATEIAKNVIDNFTVVWRPLPDGTSANIRT